MSLANWPAFRLVFHSGWSKREKAETPPRTVPSTLAATGLATPKRLQEDSFNEMRNLLEHLI